MTRPVLPHTAGASAARHIARTENIERKIRQVPADDWTLFLQTIDVISFSGGTDAAFDVMFHPVVFKGAPLLTYSGELHSDEAFPATPPTGLVEVRSWYHNGFFYVGAQLVIVVSRGLILNLKFEGVGA